MWVVVTRAFMGFDAEGDLGPSGFVQWHPVAHRSELQVSQLETPTALRPPRTQYWTRKKF